MLIHFSAQDLFRDGRIETSKYVYEGDRDQGWKIYRNKSLYLELGSGYVLAETLYCGLCSTDLAKPFLPFPLPQIVGHEWVGKVDGQIVTAEINASHWACGIQTTCEYCQRGLGNHCPERLVLGIDRLPGGFAPYVLIPQKSIFRISDGLDPEIATLTEPLAAALHGVDRTNIMDGDRVAVLGPKKLGMLILFALSNKREITGGNYSIEAIIRRDSLKELALVCGADSAYSLSSSEEDKTYDILFECTGHPEGLEWALNHTKKIVHLKSTNGQETCGLKHLTEFVVDELSIMKFSLDTFEMRLKRDQKSKVKVLNLTGEEISDLDENDVELDHYRLDELLELKKIPDRSYDYAIVGDPRSLDAVIRANGDSADSWIQPLGTIFLKTTANAVNIIFRKVYEGLEIRSSRCGPFRPALDLLFRTKSQHSLLKEKFISKVLKLNDLEDAIKLARTDPEIIKCVLKN